MLVRQIWPVKKLGVLGLRSISRACLWPELSGLVGNSLRVLAYHRVCNPDAADFFGMKSVVSARPKAFAQQMDYLSRYYHPVSLEQCLSWIYENRPLPPRALLITFDDGYRDNLIHALPILAARKMPFVLFAATGYLEDECVFFWDWAGEAFRHSPVKSAKLPKLGERSWKDGSDDAVANEWVQTIIRLDESARAMAIDELSEILKHPVQERPLAGTHLTWSDLKEMLRNGCTVGAHTVSHPMIASLSLEEAEQEIQTSKVALENRLGVPVQSFAFPFGEKTHYRDKYLPILSRVGIKIAFRSTGAINLSGETRANPFEIRRCGVGLSDRHEEDFAIWASGAPRLWQH
jgi:peptidoglycan/xylan/chitin deacetylase (PgdA/CDA1 family)